MAEFNEKSCASHDCVWFIGQRVKAKSPFIAFFVNINTELAISCTSQCAEINMINFSDISECSLTSTYGDISKKTKITKGTKWDWMP